jgi:hypothetical protein
MFEAGENQLKSLFDRVSDTISYFRDGAAMADGIKSKIGTTMFRTMDRDGYSLIQHSRDFIVKTEDLPITPKVRDVIEYNGARYQVTAPDSEPCWMWHSRHSRSFMRIHTTETSAL